MFFPESRVRVFLYGQPADMRKSFDGLYALARQGFTLPTPWPGTCSCSRTAAARR